MTFEAILKNISEIKTAVNFWAPFEKIGLLFILTSGHTVCNGTFDAIALADCFSVFSVFVILFKCDLENFIFAAVDGAAVGVAGATVGVAGAAVGVVGADVAVAVVVGGAVVAVVDVASAVVAVVAVAVLVVVPFSHFDDVDRRYAVVRLA